MSIKKEEVLKEYSQILLIKCEECGTIAESTAPCIKCKNTTFLRVYKVVEIEKNESEDKDDSDT